MSAAETLVGRELHATYRVVRPISKGGMGAIYEAVHTRLPGKRYALKVLHPAFAENEELLARFRREAEICSALGHEHIVEVHDTNVTAEGVAYLVMELLDGEDLAGRIKRGPMHLGEVLRLTHEMASALDAAHRAHIVHRDLKPQNVFLVRRPGREDRVKILDFGISKVLDSQTVMTREHALVGTPYYMSPEQADGRVTDIDGRTDVFALGAIVWEMLTGVMAFAAPNHSVALYRVSFVDPPEVHTLRPDVPQAVSLVLRRAMAKVREARTPSVLDFARELEAAVMRGEVPANVPPPALASIASLQFGATVPPQTDPTARPPSVHPSAAGSVVPPPLPPQSYHPPPPSYHPPPPLPPPSVHPAPPGSIHSVAGASGELSGERPPAKSRAPMYVAAGVVIAAFTGGGIFVALQGDGDKKPPIAVTTPTTVTVAAPVMPNLTPKGETPPAQPDKPVQPPPAEPPPPQVIIEPQEPMMVAVAEGVAAKLKKPAARATAPVAQTPPATARPEPPPVRIEPAKAEPPPVVHTPPPVVAAPPPAQTPAYRPPVQPVQQQPAQQQPPPAKKKTGTIFDD